MTRVKINKEIIDPEYLEEKEVLPYGTGAHVVLPLKHKGRKAIVIIERENIKKK